MRQSKKIFITGASGGIGSAICDKFFQIDYTFLDDNMYFWRHFNEINISPLSDLMRKDEVFSNDCFHTLYNEIKEKEKIYF